MGTLYNTFKRISENAKFLESMANAGGSDEHAFNLMADFNALKQMGNDLKEMAERVDQERG